ncbi:MAG: 50S ribosomal protein L22 [Oligoflexia bacterium]|nr:50S ribosomal protein L22 [Oligoflexia bacterium]
MSIKVEDNNVQVSARKVRQVVDLIRGSLVSDALKILKFNEKRGIALAIAKTLNNGLAIASKNPTYNLDKLIVEHASVDEGITIKRVHARAQGRAYRVKYRTSKIKIKLSEDLNSKKE